MSDWKSRLREKLEPILKDEPDPRPQLSAYHDMPCALFHYPPEDEFAVRAELGLLKTRLEEVGKRITTISLAACLDDALRREDTSLEKIGEAERGAGLPAAIETVHTILEQYSPLPDVVLERMPKDADPLKEIVFITRAGALFPVYQISALLEQMMGKVQIPTVLFYPGALVGPATLSFLGVVESTPRYRLRIF